MQNGAYISNFFMFKVGKKTQKKIKNKKKLELLAKNNILNYMCVTKNLHVGGIARAIR